MPRRRMIDPQLWDDEYIGKLTDTERLFIIGCIGNADDDGRLKGSGDYIKAAVFMYDREKTSDTCADLKSSLVQKMQSWPSNHPYRLIPYQNGSADYLFFPSWVLTNKPSHPTPSKLPPPPPETLPIFSGAAPEPRQSDSPGSPSQVRSGQSSLGKVSIGQVRAVQEDLTKFLHSEKDLTDFLTDFLTSILPRAGGRNSAMEKIRGLWQARFNREIDGASFQEVHHALGEYSAPVLAVSIAKTLWYGGGKRNTAKYFKTVLGEHAKGQDRNRSP